MNSNKLILIILAALSLLTLSLPYKIKKESAILILVTVLVGYSVTRQVILSVCIGLILGNIYVSKQCSNEVVSVEGFKSKKFTN